MIKSPAGVSQRFAIFNFLISVVGSYFVRSTGVPRPNPSVFDALPLFTPISKFPLEPI